ncbi:MAG TPA: hypothetical protein VH183_12040 [Burkholderiaceae bacterium]|nr:hypothetical protein [Burkholderiaceae bacterium]
MRKVLGLLLVQLLAMCIGVSAATPAEQFAQMLEVLQKTPKDDSLRENIARLARELKPAPPIPEEARRALVRGNTALEEATAPDDYARAAKIYEEAATLAPWWGAAYLDLARAQELALDYRSAQRNLKLYMLTIVSPDDARKAQDYLYALEDKQERADRTKNENDSRFGWLSGGWTVTKKVLDQSGYAVVQADPVATRGNIEGDHVTLKVLANTLAHDYRGGGYLDSEIRVENSFRVSYDPSGQLVMELFGARDTYTCPTAYDWNQVDFDLSSDRRMITATREYLYGPPSCKPSGYSIVWVFERAQ